MKKKTPQRVRYAPLQTLEMVPITDPVEIAALEKRIHAAEKALAERAVREARARLSKARKKAR